MPNIPAVYYDTIWKFAISVVVIIITLVVSRAISRLLRKRIEETSQRKTLRMLIRNGVLIIGAIILLIIWLGFGSSFTVAMGILGAGIAFASQEIIGSLSGFLTIVTGSLFRIGDRVKIGNVAGDVLDISLLRTKVMEIGEWVKADQYTGRIVSVANRAVFSDPVINYTQHWIYLWDEVTLPITYDSNWQKAAKIILDHGQEYSSHSQPDAKNELHKVVGLYPSIDEDSVEPSLYIEMTDNWIEITLRYIVDPHERRTVKADLHLELLKHFEEESDITIASATTEIVGFPPLTDARTNQ